MRTILTPTIALYWVVVFAAYAVAAGAPQDASALSAVLATGHAVAGACFLWLATASLLTRRHADAGVEEVATRAVVAGVIVLGMSVGLRVPSGVGVSVIDTSAALAALAASYVAIRMEHRLAREEGRAKNYSPLVARRLAAGAAHGSMLARIAGRNGQRTEHEA